MGGPALAKAGDRAAHELIVSGLARARPEDAVISEEDDRGAWPWPRPDRQWIVDPLDGTREYGEGRVGFRSPRSPRRGRASGHRGGRVAC